MTTRMNLAEAMEQIKDPNDDIDFEPAPLMFLAKNVHLFEHRADEA